MSIDLHTHTTESDGTVSPEELVRSAAALGLEALGITDHDTFAGYDQAKAPARAAGLDLVCGIELSTKFRFPKAARSKSVHLLAYFLNGAPPEPFRAWLGTAQRARRDRNARLAARLQSLGLEVRLEEVEALGRSLAGRPHFARVLMTKGYVSNHQEAFDRYLGERGKAYTEREEPALEAALARIAEHGGVSSLAHPIRVEEGAGNAFGSFASHLKEAGLTAIEVWHSDHEPRDIRHYLEITQRLDLLATGGTDFHGEAKPGVRLGVGRGNLTIPRELLDRMRATRAA